MTTVNEMLEKYMWEELPKLARRSQIDYLRHLEILRAHFGTRHVDDVKPRDIGQFLDVQKGKIQRAKIVSVLSTAYSLAVGKWWIAEKNPCKMVIKPKGKPRTRYVTDAEYEAVRSICSARLQVAMDLAFLTGQRQGDVLKLRWDHIDVHGTAASGFRPLIHIRQGKTGKRFAIKVTEKLEEVLLRAKRQSPALPKAYVVRNRFGERFSSAGFRSMWQRSIKKAVARGLIKTPFTFHDLRAKCASDHADIQKASDLLRHDSVQMTKSVYDRSIRIVEPLH